MKLILFTQPNCGPCGVLKPRAEAAAKLLGLPLEVVDCTRNPALATRLQIRSTPTLLLLNGAVRQLYPASRYDGVPTAEELAAAARAAV
jgi:thioredoxin-like negative regulator of GroEL